MPDSDLPSRIQGLGGRFTQGRRRIAQYVLDNLETVAFLTAAQLAQETGVSESTVVRFAISLGYAGYPEMQQSIQERIKLQLTTVDRVIGSQNLLGGDNGLVARIMRADMQNIALTLRDLPADAFDRAVKMIIGARDIYVIAFRGPAALAHFLGFNLQWTVGGVRMVDNAATMFEQLEDIGPGDVAIGVTFPRYTNLAAVGFRHARDKGAATIAITDSVMSPLAAAADIVLPARSNIPSFVDSLVAPMSLVNAILTAVSLYDRERTMRTLGSLEEVWRKHDILANAPGPSGGAAAQSVGLDEIPPRVEGKRRSKPRSPTVPRHRRPPR
jgi:DNA-binding MurR/RpiR family transcriptional regulator